MSITEKQASDLLRRFPKRKLVVVGDLMLDEFVYGEVTRISPEAPVPVVRVKHEKSMPGGASNVAWNIRSLGARASVAGILGRDHGGNELQRILKKDGVGLKGTLVSSGVKTTIKTRVIAEQQQVVRVDYEDISTYPPRLVQKFIKAVERELADAHAVIIEDYGKGLLEQPVVDAIMAVAKQRKIPVGLDPKDGHDLHFQGLTVATPNRKEAFGIVGRKDAGAHEDPLKDAALKQTAEALLGKWGAEHVVITLGAQGMYLASANGRVAHVPTRAREVFDVSGAGDTVIATMMCALASGADFHTAAGLANVAAGIVVAKVGTAICTPDEIKHELRRGRSA